MTIEELKALAAADGDINRENLSNELWEMRHEILALVEAVDVEWLTQHQGCKEVKKLFTALDAFNTKLEAL